MAGVMFCGLYTLTGRLWVPIGVHAAWNLAQGYLFGAAVSGGNLGGPIAVSTARAGAPTWLTGGTFGPEASLPALTLITAVTIAALVGSADPTLPAEPSALWAHLTYTESMGSWNPSITSMYGVLEVGERITVRIAPAGGRAVSFKPRITAVEPGRRLEWLGTLGLPGSLTAGTRSR